MVPLPEKPTTEFIGITLKQEILTIEKKPQWRCSRSCNTDHFPGMIKQAADYLRAENSGVPGKN